MWAPGKLITSSIFQQEVLKQADINCCLEAILQIFTDTSFMIGALSDLHLGCFTIRADILWNPGDKHLLSLLSETVNNVICHPHNDRGTALILNTAPHSRPTSWTISSEIIEMVVSYPNRIIVWIWKGDMSAVWNMTGQDVTLGFCHAGQSEWRKDIVSFNIPTCLIAYFLPQLCAWFLYFRKPG